MSNEVRIRVTGQDQSQSAFASARQNAQGLRQDVQAIALATGFQSLSAGLAQMQPALLGATEKATGLAEAQSKSNTIFGESQGAINDWARGAVRDFGQTERGALDAAGSFGNMFDQLGIGSAQAAQMSMSITELASDFASFHNADITQVLDAQSAAFRGEYDALQRFLPLINAAAVEQKAMAMTGKENAKELTAQEKALAVYELMLEGAGQAAGDFDRTAFGLANTQRQATAAWEEAEIVLGQRLAPAQKAALDLFLEMPQAMQAGVAAAVQLGPALGEVVIGAASIARGGPAMLGILKGIGPAAVAAGPALLGLAAAFGAAYAAQELLGDSSPEWVGTLEALGDRTSQLAFLQEKLAETSGLERDAVKKAIETLEDQIATEEEAARFKDELAAATEQATVKTETFADRVAELDDSLKDMTESAGNAFGALDKFKSVPTQEQLDLQAAISDLDYELALHEEALLKSKAAGDGNEESIKAQIAALDEEREKLTASMDVLEANRQRTVDMGQAKLGASGQVDGLVQSEDDLIQKVRTATEFMAQQEQGARNLDAALRTAIASMDAALARGDVVGAQEQYLVATGSNAGGTEYWRGGLTWVGERGPELIDLPQGSKVYSNPESMQIARESQGGGVVVNMNNPTIYARDKDDARRSAGDLGWAIRLMSAGVPV